MTKILAVIGSQRAGTTVLARALSSAANASYFGEIFHCDPIERSKKSNYFSWHGECFGKIKSPSHLFTDYKSAERHCKAFLQHLVAIGEAAHSDFIVIDLKYPVFNFIEWPWTEGHQRPTLLHTLIELFDSYLLHIVRRNLVDVFISRMRAEQFQIWHLDDARTISCNLDKHQLEDFIAMSLEVSSRFSRLVHRAPHERVAELIYEESFVSFGSGISDTAKDSLSPILESLRISPSDVRTTISKSLRSKLNVANIKEIHAHFFGGEFDDLFRSSVYFGDYWHNLS